MPFSTASAFETMRPDLGGSVMDYDIMAELDGLIGMSIMPVFESAMAAGPFGTIPLKALLQDPETQRAANGHYPRGHFEMDKGSFVTVDHGHERVIDDRNAAQYREYLEYEQIMAQLAQAVVLKAHEIRVKNLIFDQAKWVDTAAASKWDLESSKPITDVDAAANRMFAATGMYPNAIVMNRKVFKHLRNVDQIIDRVKYVESALPTEISTSHMARAFDVPNVFVAGSARNTANEAQAAVVDHLWGSTLVALVKIATTNNIQEACVGRTIHWAADGSNIGATIETYRDPQARADIVRARMDTDEVLMTPKTVELIKDVT